MIRSFTLRSRIVSPPLSSVPVNGPMLPATITGAADVYVSDFGAVTFQAVQYGLTRDVLLADTSFWAVGTLRPMTKTALAKTGDADRFQLLAEKCLISKNEKASAVIADLI